MNQGAILQHPLSLHANYPLSSDHDCIDQFGGHPHHSTYASGSAVELRRDGTLTQPAPTPFAFTATNNAPFVPDGGVASDTGSYRTGNNFTESSSGSISTSPSSAASSLAYNNYPLTSYTSLPTFSGAVQQPQSFLQNSYAGSRVPSILDGATSGMPPPPHPFRSPIPSVSTAGDRESYAHSTNYSARSQLSPNSFGSYNDTPRSVLPGLAMSAGSTGYPVHMAATTAQGYNGSQNDSQAFPWPKLEVLLDMTCEGKQVTPEIRCKVEKGFFLSTADQKWTCYRRNYFSVQCSFEIHPFINNGRLYLKRMNSTEQIQAFGIRLSAAVDGSNGKGIELVQHTPKRDNGPKNKIEVVKLSPSAPAGRQDNAISPHHMYPVAIPTFRTTGTVPGPFLPLQNSSEPNTPSTQNNTSSQVATTYPYHGGGSSIPIAGQSTIHNFERVQFKTATANNGKRRASQQYFHLIMELFADVRKDGSDNPQWVKVAHRSSDKIVVRGRSPSHYQNEGQNNQAGRGGNAGGGNNYPAGGAATYAGLNTGGYRTSAGAYGGGIGAGHGYRQSHHVFHPASGDSASSPESVEVGAIDSDHPMDAVLSDSERASIQEYEGYQYYPSATYENVLQLPPLSKPENTTRYSTEPRQYAVKAEYPEAIPGAQWQMGGCSRFQGFESSRGYFPDLSAGTPSYS